MSNEVRCPNCGCINLTHAHVCIRCGNTLCNYGSTPVQTEGFSWDLVYNNLINGDDDKVYYALSVIQQSRYEQVIPNLVKIFEERHPTTNKKISVDIAHKGYLILALGMIGTLEAGKAIAAIVNKYHFDFFMDEILRSTACYSAGNCEQTSELMTFVLNTFSGSPTPMHFAGEKLKKFGEPAILQELFRQTIIDLNYATVNATTGYYGSSNLGKALVVADYALRTHLQNNVTAQLNMLPLVSNASPQLVGQLSEELQRLYALQRRIEVIESIVRRCGAAALNDTTARLKKSHERFVAACVVARLYHDPRDWMQPILGAVNGAWLTTPMATKLSGYDALVRLLKQNSVPQWEALISAGLKNNNAIVRSTVASSILIHGLERFYPAVLQHANDPKKEVRASLVYGLVLLQKRAPRLAEENLQAIATQNNDKDARFLAEQSLKHPELVQALQAQL